MTTSATDRIKKQIKLPAPVWRVLTDFHEFNEWFGVKLESPFVQGKSTRGKIMSPGYEHLVMEVVVEKTEAETLFAFHWHPYAVDPEIDYSDESPTLVEFKLEPIVDGTLLTVIESGFDAIPSARRDEAFRMNDGGWSQQIKKLESHVSNNQ